MSYVVPQAVGRPYGHEPWYPVEHAAKYRLWDLYAPDAGVPLGAPAPYWPPSRGGYGYDAGAGYLDPALFEPLSGFTSGASGRFGVTGVTRDLNGTPVGGVTVKLFRTATDELVETRVSNENGIYLLTTQYYPDTHYVVAWKNGLPDIAGATPNTLIAG